MVTVTTNNMQFVDGMTTWDSVPAISPCGICGCSTRHMRLLMFTVSPSAIEQETIASVISGFEVYQQGLGF